MADQAENERRIQFRKKKTLFCQLRCQGNFYPAVVLDLSPSGLFVRTALAPPPGTDVEVILRFASGGIWKIRAQTARQPQVDSNLDSLSARGLGLRITEAPAGFAEFVKSL